MSPQKWAMIQALDSRMFGQQGDDNLAYNRRKLAAEKAKQTEVFLQEEDNRYEKLHSARFRTRFPLSDPKTWWSKVPVKVSPVFPGINTRFLQLDATPSSVVELLHDRGAPLTVAKLAGSSLGTRRGSKLLLSAAGPGSLEQDLLQVGEAQRASVDRFYVAEKVLIDLCKMYFLLHVYDPFPLNLLGFAHKQRMWSWHPQGLRAFKVAVNAIIREAARSAQEGALLPPTEVEMADTVKEEFAKQGWSSAPPAAMPEPYQSWRGSQPQAGRPQFAGNKVEVDKFEVGFHPTCTYDYQG